MSTEENMAGIRRMVEEMWNKGNLEIIPELYTPDYVGHGAGGQDIKGPESIKQTVTMLRNAFPDIHMTIDDMVAEGDKVAWRATFTGTHKGEYLGIAPTGKQVTESMIVISHCANGKEMESWISSNQLVIYQQLGVSPPGK